MYCMLIGERYLIRRDHHCDLLYHIFYYNNQIKLFVYTTI
jgi:hypothetical protein